MMKIFESEYRFMQILWEYEPVNSTELVKLCNQELGWKKTTTYTVIKKLAQKHALANENATVTSLVTKETVDRQAGEELLERTCNGNIPAFLAAFLKDRKLSKEDVDKIKQLIDEAEEG